MATVAPGFDRWTTPLRPRVKSDAGARSMALTAPRKRTLVPSCTTEPADAFPRQELRMTGPSSVVLATFSNAGVLTADRRGMGEWASRALRTDVRMSRFAACCVVRDPVG